MYKLIAVTTLALCAAAPAAAVITVTAGGQQVGNDGLFSTRVGLIGTETFNRTNCLSGDPAFTLSDFDGGGFVLSENEVANRRRRPTNDTSCYLSIGDLNNSTSVFDIGINYNETDDYIAYFGLYWGSIDEYNFIRFYDASFNLIEYVPGDNELSGDELVALLGVPLYTSQYVNFAFEETDGVAGFYLGTNANWATEVDNLSVAVETRLLNIIVDPAASGLTVAGDAALRAGNAAPAAVNAPLTGLLLPLSFGLLAALRRRRAAKFHL